MELYLTISIVGLLFVTLISFVLMAKETRWTLAILVPVLLASGVLGVMTHKSLLGYPVKMEWEEMPEEWTVIFFHVEGKRTITLWLLLDDTTRLVQLPYVEQAEEAMQQQKPIMGQGIPVTFGEKQAQDGEGESQGGGDGDGEEGQEGDQAGQSWGYKVQSYGDPIDSGKLPAK